MEDGAAIRIGWRTAKVSLTRLRVVGRWRRRLVSRLLLICALSLWNIPHKVDISQPVRANTSPPFVFCTPPTHSHPVYLPTDFAAHYKVTMCPMKLFANIKTSSVFAVLTCRHSLNGGFTEVVDRWLYSSLRVCCGEGMCFKGMSGGPGNVHLASVWWYAFTSGGLIWQVVWIDRGKETGFECGQIITWAMAW